MKITSILSEKNRGAEWAHMIEGAASTAAVANVATVAMPDIASVPSRAANMPESFLAQQASTTINAPAPTRGGGRGR